MAGGHGTRLYPSGRAISKSLIPVYDKPMIYYPLTLLMMAGVKEILLIGVERDMPRYRELLGDGSRLGIRLCYRGVVNPLGLLADFIKAGDFIGSDMTAIALGDNIFIGEKLDYAIRTAKKQFEETGGVQLFCHYAEDPRSYGVVEYDEKGNILSLQSKPQVPVSHYAVTGLFFFDRSAIGFAEQTEIGADGTISFPALLRRYLRDGRLHSALLDDDIEWFDAGTPQRLLEASLAVKAYQDTHDAYAGCIEETAAALGLIDAQQLENLARDMEHTEYGRHLMTCAARCTLAAR